MGRQETLWNSQEYVDSKYKHFGIFRNYLGKPVGKLLDIGCGFAYEAGWYHIEDGTEIWLLDRDRKGNETDGTRYNDFGPVDDFEAYNSFKIIHSSLQSRGISDYKLLEPKDNTWIHAPKFDVIMSESSMGFHYPVRTYKDFIREHSHNDTRVFCSLRNVSSMKKFVEDVVYMHNDKRSGFVELKVQGISVL